MSPVKASELHDHLKARMVQRGVTLEEIETVLKEGWEAHDAKEGTKGKVLVFPFNNYWGGRYYEEKEVTVFYRIKDEKMILLTVIARYGRDFIRKG